MTVVARPLPNLEQRPDRALVAALRGELAAVEPARACCRAAELAGLAGDRRGRRPRSVARLAMRLGRPATPAEAPDVFDWGRAAEHCRMAWLRGRFLACGSLSLASGRSHLEFVLPMPEARELASRLTATGLHASLRTRRGAGVVTWKSAETILTFLRLTGASGAALELEARLVSRTLRGALNRAINAESANLLRQVAAASRQLEALQSLEASGQLKRLSPVDRAVALERRQAPEATYDELAARLGLTRSHVQRALGRVVALAGG